MTENVTKWVDLDSQEFKTIECYDVLQQAIHEGIEEGEITVDKMGYLWQDNMPLHTEVAGELVKLRLSTMAAN